MAGYNGMEMWLLSEPSIWLCGASYSGVCYSAVWYFGVCYSGASYSGVCYSGASYADVCYSGVYYSGAWYSGVWSSGDQQIIVGLSHTTSDTASRGSEL